MDIMNHQEDTLLIEQVLAGHPEAYAILVSRYERLVFTLAVRMLKSREDAEEIAQDVFVKAYQALSTYRGSSKFSTWLYRITYNNCLDLLAKQKRQPAMGDVEKLQPVNYTDLETVLDAMEKDERSRHLKDCISRLPEEEAFLITVYYFEEQSISELAVISGLSESNVKIKLYRARKRLFKMINAELFHEKRSVI